MSSNVFHDHLDVCERCRENPFNLCATGERLLVTAAMDIMAVRRHAAPNVSQYTAPDESAPEGTR